MPLMTNHEPPRAEPTQPAPADRDWFGGRRWTGIAAVGVLIVVALSLVIVFALHHGGGSDRATGAGTPSGSSATSPSAAPSSALPTTVPTAAPAGTSWSIYQTVALPSLPGAGPAHVDGAIATGYAHTPLGALLAVANEGFRYRLATDDQWRAAAAAMLAPGAGTDAWLKVRAAHPYGPGGGVGTDTLLQIAGFQFVSYTPSDAVIQIATGNPTDRYQVVALHVTWLDGDWKFVPASDGGQAANLQQVDSLAGFVEWRGV